MKHVLGLMLYAVCCAALIALLILSTKGPLL